MWKFLCEELFRHMLLQLQLCQRAYDDTVCNICRCPFNGVSHDTFPFVKAFKYVHTPAEASQTVGKYQKTAQLFHSKTNHISQK